MKKNILACLAVLVLASSAQATVPASSIYAGGLIGAGHFDNNVGTKTTVGVSGGYLVDPNWGVGIFANFSPLTSTTVGTTTINTNMWVFAAEGNYHLTGDLDGLHFGGKLGVGMSTASTTGTVSTSSSSTDLTFGPSLGYDYGIGNGISLGVEANYLRVASTTGINLFNTLAAVRVWF
jgi:hypothetical protein